MPSEDPCAHGIACHPGCTRCQLHRGRRSICLPGEGSLNAEILFVGQAPGEVEDSVGRPFWGRSGQLLRAALEDAGITVFRIENAVRCFPPGNRAPSAAEVKACWPYLLHTIRRMPNLKVVVCLGAVPMRLFTRKTGITRWVGTPLPTEFEGVTAYPVFHPAYILRNPEMGDKFLDLLKGVGTLLSGVDHDFVRLVKGKAVVSTIQRFLRYTTPVAFDFETTGLDPRLGSVLDVSFYGGRGKPVSCRLDTPEAVPVLREFLGSPVPKLVHHLPFEAMWSEHHFGVVLQNVVGDTRLLAYRENSNRPSNLGTVSATHVPEVNGFKVDSEAALLNGEHWWELDEVVRGTRNAVDAYSTWVIYQKLRKILGPEIMRWHRELDLPVAVTVARMGYRGMAVDLDRVMEFEKKYRGRITRARAAARRTGVRALLTSPQQLDQNFRELGLDTGQRTPTGQMKLDDAALRELLEEFPHTRKWIKPILDYRAARKFMGTYVVGLSRHVVNGLVLGNFRFPGTVTWRLACNRPNLLNQPRGEWRRVFVSRYQYGTIVRADYSQAELRVIASLSGDPVMLKVYREGGDIHTTTATRFYGESFTKDGRARAKAVNFGVIYGGGPAMLQTTLRKGGIELDIKEARSWVRVWRDTYKVAWKYMEGLQKEVLEKGSVTLPNYGIVRYTDFTGADTPGKRAKLAREGANTPIQGAAALITLRAGMKLEHQLRPEEGILVNMPYDELVVDSPGDGLRAAELMRSCMEQAAKEEPWLLVPMEVEVTAGPDWGTQEGV